MKLLLILISLLVCGFLSAQRPSIDTSILDKWPSVGNPYITANGQYVMYELENVPKWSCTLEIRSTFGKWRKMIEGVKDAQFSGDGEWLLYRSGHDSLCLLVLGREESIWFTHVRTYNLLEDKGGSRLLCYISDSDKPGKLVLRDLSSAHEQSWENVVQYSLSPGNKRMVWEEMVEANEKEHRFHVAELAGKKEDVIWKSQEEKVGDFLFDISGNVLVWRSCGKDTGNKITTLHWLDMKKRNDIVIWQGSQSITSQCMDREGKQFAFVVSMPSDDISLNTIWYFTPGLSKAQVSVNSESVGLGKKLQIGAAGIRFSKNGEFMFFNLDSLTEHSAANNGSDIEVWSYRDAKLQSEQLADELNTWTFKAVMNIRSGKVIRLEDRNKVLMTQSDEALSQMVIVTLRDKDDEIPWWNIWSWAGIYVQPKPYWLVSLHDGSFKLVDKLTYDERCIFISPSENYIIYYKSREKSYFSYEIKTRSIRNISQFVSTQWENEYHTWGDSSILGICGWLRDDKGVLIYDNYDIWLLDPSGKSLPVNMTNAYGKAHNIKLRLVLEDEAMKGFNIQTNFLLTAFNAENKYNGFYRMAGINCNPVLLTMGPYLWYRTSTQVPDAFDAFSNGMRPLKAVNKNIWMIRRESPSQAPNYFVTRDFIHFRQVSKMEPEKNYNWLTTELINYRQLDGSSTQGILYKPTNFNPNKRYPVILQFYERFSFRMFEYPFPRLTTGRINIPWIVSQDYLVFTPDIHFTRASISGQVPGEAAYNSVVAGAQYLAKLPYVDSQRIGIQGHSFGGGETNWIIANTGLFAAACGASGTICDEISAYLSLIDLNGKLGGEFRSKHAEIYHDRIGATLWERPDLYIKASPVLRANLIMTPLLIMDNRADIYWRQGMEMYLALRRLGRKCWLLQYNNGGHVVQGIDAVDFTIRVTQFFDHYLKGAPAPKWMTEGVPYSKKGIDSGLELDLSGRKP